MGIGIVIIFIANKGRFTIKFVELFAGVGGFRLGLEALGHKCVFASEIDKYACYTYEANFREKPAGDITKIDAKDIPDHDILTGGFPCQAFSIAGNRKGFDDTRGTLFFDIARILKEKQPKYLLLENVPGLLSHDSGKTFATIISTLEGLGYGVDFRILNSKNFGVPQNRRRVFIVGKLGADLFWKFAWPISTPSNKCVADIMESEVDDKYFLKNPKLKKPIKSKTPKEASLIKVGDLDVNYSQGARVYADKSISATISSRGGGVGANTGLYKVAQINKGQSGVVLDPKGQAQSLQFGNGSRASTGLYKIGLIGKDNQANRVYDHNGLAQTQSALGGGRGAKTGLYTLDPKKISKTIRTTGRRSLSKKHNYDTYAVPKQIGIVGEPKSKRKDRQSNRIYDKKAVSPAIATSTGAGMYNDYEIRRLTPRECARLQGFPDRFKLPCSDTQSYKQMGNAVSVPVITAIARGFDV